jgi:hypothetical protein
MLPQSYSRNDWPNFPANRISMCSKFTFTRPPLRLSTNSKNKNVVPLGKNKKKHWSHESKRNIAFASSIRNKQTQQVVKNRGQHCGNIELAGYLQNVVGTVPLVLDLCISHERWESSTDPTLNGHLHYPNDLDKPLNEESVDKFRE